MAGHKLQLLCAASVAAMAPLATASAQSVSIDKVEALEAQINSLQQELRALKAKVNNSEKQAAKQAEATKQAEKTYAAAAAAAAATKAPPPPPPAVAKMSAGFRPSICSPDGLNCIALTSRLHFDVGGFDYRPDTAATVPQHLNDGVNARRARIGVLGTFMGDWNYALIYDFGGTSDGFGGTVGSLSNCSLTGGPTLNCNVTTRTGLLPGGITSGIENAYLSYQGIKGLAIEGGYMDVPYTLDEATSSNDIMFMERASSQVIAANIAAGDFRSAVGARWYDDWIWAGAYATGPTSGAIHSGSSNPPDGMTEQFGGFARVAVQPLHEKDYSLHIGGDVEALFKPPLDRITNARTLTLADRPELRIDPTTITTTGAIANVTGAQVFSLEGAATWGPLFFQSEFFWFNIDRGSIPIPGSLTGPNLNFNGGYAQASWTLTGETRTYNASAGAYNGIVPNNPFYWTRGGWGGWGGWGAWEIAARYSVIDLNDRLGFRDGIAGGKQTVFTAGLNWYVNRNIRIMLNYLHGDIDKQNTPVGPGILDVGAKFDAVAMRTQIAF